MRNPPQRSSADAPNLPADPTPDAATPTRGAVPA